MLSNSVPIMPKCTVETWKLESYLIEYEHYIPLKNDFSDLNQQMDWCLENLDKCEEIAYNSRLYVLQFFDKNFFDAWVTGFVGGANWISKKSIHADETVFGMALLKFCKSNPSENVFTGVMAVYKDFN